MEFGLVRFIAIFLGYAVPLAVWFWMTRRVPATWAPAPRPVLERPGRELAAALAAAGLIMLLNVAYNAGLLPGGPKLFLLHLAIIWSPLALVLLWRRQGLDTCLLPLRGLGRKLAWGIAGSVLGMAAFLLAEGRPGDLGLSVTLLGQLNPVRAIQSLLQFVGIGFLLVRIGALAGRTTAVLICGALYGLVKYPYYMSAYGMSFAEASGVIAFSIVVAFAVIATVFDREDVLVIAILHIFLDLVQKS